MASRTRKRVKNFALALMSTGVFAVSVMGQVTDSQCEQRVELRQYSACLPKAWKWKKDPELNGITACNGSLQRCTGTGGGFPLQGRVIVSIAPAALLPGRSRTVGEVIQRAQAGEPELRPATAVPAGPGRKCQVVRLLMTPIPVWNEVYGIEAGAVVLRVSAQYWNDPRSVQVHRQAVEVIVRSITHQRP